MRDFQSYVDDEFKKYPEEAMRLYDGKGSESLPDQGNYTREIILNP